MQINAKLRNAFGQRFGHLDIVWRNVLIVLALQLAALYGLYLKLTTVSICTRLFVAFYGQMSGLGVTAARHRYFSHRSFKGNRFVDVLMMVLACTAFEQSILTWCRDHRLHHKYSDTDADPYNSSRGFFFCHMGWIMVRKHKDVKEKGKSINLADLKNDPVVMFEYKYSLLLAVVFTILVPTLVPFYFWNETLQCAFFVSTVYRYFIILHITWCVNSFAHLYGMRSYDKHINPTENMFVATIAMGEGFHNYHHTFPWDYNAAEFGTDFTNMTTAFIDVLAYFGAVTERKRVSCALIKMRQGRTGNLAYIPNNRRLWSKIIGYLFFITVFS